jgi:hypothetical protein
MLIYFLHEHNNIWGILCVTQFVVGIASIFFNFFYTTIIYYLVKIVELIIRGGGG